MKLRIGLVAILVAALATCAIPASPQSGGLPNAVTGTMGAANATVAVGPVGNGGSCSAEITGTWSGTITFQIIGQSGSATTVQAFPYSSSTGQTTTTSNGMFYWIASATQQCQVKMTSYSSGTATATVAVSAAAAMNGTGGGGGGATIAVSSPLSVSPLPSGATTQTISCGPCYVKSSSSSWDSVACAETSNTHCYPLNGPIGTASGDCQFDNPTGTAAPSPVPLATPTPSGDSPSCGYPSISHDGETSAYFGGGVIAATPNPAYESYFVVPESVWPASGSFSVEIVFKSVFASLANGGVAQYLFSFDHSTHFETNIWTGSCPHTSGNYPCLQWIASGTSGESEDWTPSGSVNDVVYTYDGTHLGIFENCELVNYSSVTVAYPTTSGFLGMSAGQVNWFSGRIAKFAVYNAVLTDTQICNHTAALGA